MKHIGDRRVLFGVVLLATLLCVGCRQAPEALFREAVSTPIPSSVQIINATQKSRLGNIEIWLHFKISKQDLDSLLKSEPYKDLGSSKLNYSAYGPPTWWTPDKLGAGKRCLDCEVSPHFGRDRSAKDILVNGNKNEAFFLLRSWYNY
jgi:hypothetical protein